jgi:hypothetical protein
MPIISPFKRLLPLGGKGGASWSSYWTTTKTFNLVIEGHSFIIPAKLFSWYVMRDMLPVTYDNMAVGGKSIPEAEAVADTLDAKLTTETATHKNILVLWIGFNDIVAFGMPTAYNTLKSYVEDRVAAGWMVFVFTMTPSSTYDIEANRTTFNNLLRSELGLIDNVRICDTDTISELDDASNLTYYSDGVHLTDAGLELAAALAKDQLDIICPNRNTTLTLTSPTSEWTLTPSGDGTGIGKFIFTAELPTYIQIVGGDAKFYTDAAATTGETDIFVPGNYSSIWVKCSEASTLLVDKKITLISYTTVANAPSLGGNIGGQSDLTYIDIPGNNTMSGSVTGMRLTRLLVYGTNTVSGDITLMTSLQLIGLRGSNTVTGDISSHTLLTSFNAQGSNTITGDIGVNSVINGITYFNLDPGRVADYTQGAEWSNVLFYVGNTAGYAFTQAEIINIMIDANNSAVGPTSKFFAIRGGNPSMADTTQGGIWGDFDGETSPSDFAVAYKAMLKTRGNTVQLNGITTPGESGDGTGFPAGFGDWYRS